MDEAFEISLARAEELDAIMDYFRAAIDDMNREGINYAAWSVDFYPDRDYIAEILSRKVTYLLRDKGEIMGVIAFWGVDNSAMWGGENWPHILPDDKIMSVHTVSASPRLKGRHAGRTLLRFAENAARESGKLALRLNVRRCNPPAIHLYESEGYVRCGECEPVPEISGDKVFYLYEKYIGE